MYIVKKSAWWVPGAVIVVLVIAGSFCYLTLSASAAATNRLQTATVQRGTIVATVSAAGNVWTPQSAVLSLQTTGTVAQTNVQAGDKVKKGQVLLTLETIDLDPAIKGARANLASAQANYDATKLRACASPCGVCVRTRCVRV